MTYSSLSDAVTGFKSDADRVDAFGNGDANATYTSKYGAIVPSIQNLIGQWNAQINVAANGILAQSTAQAGIAATQAGNAATSAGAAASSANTAVQAKNEAIAAVPPIQFVDYDALRAYSGNATRVDVTGYLVSAAPSGIAGPFARDDSDTTSTDNGATIIVAGTKRWKRVFNGTIQAAYYGAICDGTSHPLSSRFTTLAAAQAVYPSATSLTDQIDTVALQTMFDNVQSNQKLAVSGKPYTNKTIYLSFAGKDNVTVDFSAATVLVSSGPSYSFVVHGATIDRTLTGAAWGTQLVEQAYEGVTTAKRSKIIGLNVASATGGRVSSQVMFYFCDDVEADVTVKNSNGNGVEFRHCVRPKYDRILVDDYLAYGLFIYQCYGLKGGDLITSNGGRSFEIKQRHKFYGSLNHVMNNVEMVDLVGFDDPAWATGGQSFQDLVRAGASSTAIANRNFTGHEISKDVVIRKISGVVSPSAGGSVVAPSFQIGCFADAWECNGIDLDASGKTPTTIPIMVGSRGDIAAGQAGGATFGQGHKVGAPYLRNFNITDATPLIQYGVSSSVSRFKSRGCNAAVIVTQLTPASALPFGNVPQFEFRDYDIDINLALGPINTRGVLIPADTLRFVSGSANGKLRVTPTDYAAETLSNPWYVSSPAWHVEGRDEVEIALGASVNHATSYPVAGLPATGRLRFKITVAAPAAVRALQIGSSSTNALVLEPCELILANVPSGERTAIQTSAGLTMVGNHTFTGSWSNTLSDSSQRVVGLNARHIDFGTAPPTAGRSSQGDVRWNAANNTQGVAGILRCYSSGIPGSWRVIAQDGVAKGPTSSRPTKATFGVAADSEWAGIKYYDTTLAAAGKPIEWNGTNWVDYTGTIV